MVLLFVVMIPETSVFTLQNRVTQLISNAEQYTSLKKVFEPVNILPVPSCILVKECGI
jgi:hypothetical protein